MTTKSSFAGNLSHSTTQLSSLIVQLCSAVSAAATLFYWTCNTFAPERLRQTYPISLQYAPPLAVYAACATLAVTVHVRPSSLLQTTVHAGDDGRPVRRVYGAQTVLSATLIAGLVAPLTLLALLLCGDGLAPSIACLLVFAVGLRATTSLVPHRMTLIYCASLFASHAFYALGSQPTFTSIPWDTAFIGVPGNFGVQAVPAALVVLRLFTGVIMCVLALPLIAIAMNVPVSGALFMIASPDSAIQRIEISSRRSIHEGRGDRAQQLPRVVTAQDPGCRRLCARASSASDGVEGLRTEVPVRTYLPRTHMCRHTGHLCCDIPNAFTLSIMQLVGQ